MKIPKIVNAIGNIDDELIEVAENFKVTKKKNSWVKWGSLAASIVIIIVAVITNLPSILNSNAIPVKPDTSKSENSNATDTEETVENDEPKDRYKDYKVNIMSTAIVWPWEYLSVTERYTETEIEGIKYRKYSGFALSEDIISEKIGTYTFVGYDDIENKQYTEVFDAYQIKNLTKEQFIAVEMEEKFYVFKNDVYNPPQTLGELFEKIDLSDFIELKRYSENGSGPEAKHYILNDDEYIWNVLKDCKSATFIGEEEYWHLYEKDFISFTVTSEQMGVFKHSLAIREDGYLETNIFSWRYLYNIGEDAAKEIIKYAKENSQTTEYEPYMNTLVGKVTEITADYILIDDSFLCNNSKDGITYKLPINDIKISRYVDRGVIKVDSTVQVSYDGEIGKDNIINKVYSISKAAISYGDIDIEE